MKHILSAVIGYIVLAFATLGSAQESTWEYAVRVSAIVQTSPPQIQLTWPQDTRAIPNSYTVYRKAVSATAWGTSTTLPGSATTFTDSAVAVGSAYEYKIVKQSPLGYTGYGYISAGLQAPLVDTRGKVILVVDNTYAADLASELTRLQQDLVGDGWTVIRRDVARTDTPANVKNLIKNEYNADRANVKAVFLFGRVPVVRSGNLNVDGHQARALPADVFYGDMDGAWTDGNGDGIYDQSYLPSDVDLQVGRVDFANMPGKKVWNDPGSFPSERELLRQYLNKDHNFRHKLLSAPLRGLVGNRFGDFGGEAFAASGYRNFSTFFSPADTTTSNASDTAPLSEKWITYLANNSYIWAYGCGGGSATSISGLGTNGLYSDVWSTDIVGQNAKAIFNMQFGSWLVDWDTQDNIMRSMLATPSMGLTCSWSGRPHHVYHHMGLGETVGYGIRQSQNNNGLYQNQYNSELRGIHIALMGDPTLRMHQIAPPSALGGTLGSSGAQLSWQASADSVLGYHIYRATTADGPFTRLTSAPVAATTFVDVTVTGGTYAYMVRAVKLENTPSGTYYNVSQGAIATVGGSGSTLPVLSVQATDANASETAGDPGVFTITRSGSTTSALTVNYTLGGTAANGADYTTLGTAVTLPIGVASATVAITPVDDSAIEGSEIVTLTLAAGSSYSVGASSSATITIADNDSAPTPTLPTVTVTATDANASEAGPDPGAFTFTRTGDTSAALTVNYDLAGTAVKWTDYRRLEGDMPVSITIPAGASSATLTIYPFDDAEVEANETAILTVKADPAYAVGSPSTATVTIADNDSVVVLPTVSVSATDANASESGADAGTFTITRTGSTTASLTVNFSLSGSATNGTDYNSAATSVTLNAGAASATVQISPLDDTLVEGAETVVLTLAANTAYTVGSPNSATVTIADNDSAPAPAPTLPTITVTAADANATEGSTDPGVFTFTRTGDTTSPLTVNYNLAGSAIKWTDYRRLAGDMPVAIAIPAGATSADLTIYAVDDTDIESSETVLLSLAADPAYTVGSASSATITIADNDSATPPPSGTNAPPTTVSLVDYTNLELPKVGNNTLHVLSPNLLELVLINGKQPDPATVDSWNFVNSTFQFVAPALTEFAVTVNGQPVAVQSVGFKRRPFYAPDKQRDLRIANCLYLQLAGTVADNQTVEVKNPSGALWVPTMQFATAADPLRYSPVIHVNQEGYVPSLPKKAMVGYYLGNLGEMNVPASLGFKLVDAATGAPVYQGTLALRQDVGYTYTPTPYQQVLVADFSSFTTPGEYRLLVAGLGASLPFVINDGVAMSFARAYALGLYHQRCGTNNALPFTRFIHDPCHVALAGVPSPQSSFGFTWNTVSMYSSILNSENPPQIAPQLKDEASQLFPFVNKGQIDVSGGHHDAGDYSKYTINSTRLIHTLMFAVDAMPGVAALDNLGLPESGDGISDVMQEAKWEADFLAKLQDSDGGFYTMVYPQNREYENNVLPDQGDPQVVWPKTTSVTAASVAALAQCASSPRFKQQYPTEAALYLQKAQLGWNFLKNAIAQYGKDGSYQKTIHYGDNFIHNDELAWAACEMFLATGDPSIQQTLIAWFDPSNSATWRWSWWRMSESYGNAIRSYAFAAKSGRLQASQLDAAYLAKCEAQIAAAGDDALNWSQQNAYGSSFPDATKRVKGAGWYFSVNQAFDMAVAYVLNPKPEYLEAFVANMNYEGGCNPVNVTYVTGLGWKRQREIVHQYAQNDRRVLPPSGIPLGNIQSGFVYLAAYGSELGALNFPQDSSATAPYPFYDRWGDAFNVTTEFVNVDQARSLASLAYIATLTPAKTQAWKSATGQISVPAEVAINQPVTASLNVTGLDLSEARIVWEAINQEPCYGLTCTLTPTTYGPQWIEAEIQWPDGKRVFASQTFMATNGLPIVNVTATDAQASETGPDPAVFTFTRSGDATSPLTVNYSFSGTATKWNDYRRLEGDIPVSVIIPAGAASATLTVYPVDDTETEVAETIILVLSADPAYNIGTAASATATIADNDGSVVTPTLPTVAVSATDANAAEAGLDSGVLTITRTGSTTNALTVKYTLGGTASNGTDYTTLAASVTLPIGAASATVLVVPIDDTAVEGSETVVLSIAADASYQVGSPSSATVTIADSDFALPTITVTATDANAAEAGADPGVFTFTRTGDISSAVTVNYALTGTAIKWNDYRRLTGDMPVSITIPAGASSVDLTVYPVDDAEVEGAETIVLTIVPDAAYQVGSAANATVTIADNDTLAALPTVTVIASDAVASRVGPDAGQFTFTRTGSTVDALTVNYSLAGTAIKWDDYRTPLGDMPVSATIPAGAASTVLTIIPQPSASLVDVETVILTLTSDAAYTAGSPGSATIPLAGNSVSIKSVKATGAGITLTWTSQAGKIYRVAYKNNLSDPAWTDLSGNITATSSQTSWTDKSANKFTQRQYVVYVTN